jgi:ABC-2 type transport system permease protein
MLNNAFLKTIYTKRWMLLSWSLGIIALVVFTMLFYPTLSKSLGDSLKNVPDSLKSFLGDSAAYSSIAGYTDLQIFAQLNFYTIIFGVILFSGILAGEEGDGTLQTLLAQPVSRARIYIEKLMGSITLLVGVSIGVLVGILVGLVFINEHLGLGRLLGSILALILITLVFSSLAFSLGAITGKRGLSGGLAGMLAFTTFLISSLAESVKSLQFVDKLSPFHYYNKPGILQYGVHWGDLLILALISLVILIAGLVVFVRRDVYQR